MIDFFCSRLSDFVYISGLVLVHDCIGVGHNLCRNPERNVTRSRVVQMDFAEISSTTPMVFGMITGPDDIKSVRNERIGIVAFQNI